MSTKLGHMSEQTEDYISGVAGLPSLTDIQFHISDPVAIIVGNFQWNQSNVYNILKIFMFCGGLMLLQYIRNMIIATFYDYTNSIVQYHLVTQLTVWKMPIGIQSSLPKLYIRSIIIIL